MRLGPACFNPFTFTPYEIAGQIAALDLASDGRAFLGLARGTWLDAIGIDQRQPVQALEEAAGLVAAAAAPRRRRLRRSDVPAGRRDDAALRDAATSRTVDDRDLGAAHRGARRSDRRRGEDRRQRQPGDGRGDAVVRRRWSAFGGPQPRRGRHRPRRGQRRRRGRRARQSTGAHRGGDVPRRRRRTRPDGRPCRPRCSNRFAG